MAKGVVTSKKEEVEEKKIKIFQTVEVIGTGKGSMKKGKPYKVHPHVKDKLIEKGVAELSEDQK